MECRKPCSTGPRDGSTGWVLETERLFLRELREDDFEALRRVLGDSDIMCHYPYTFDDARVRRWIGRNRERYRVFGFGLWAVCRKDTGELIGDCGLTMQLIDGQIRPEIGYHIRSDQQRRGYVREAAAAVRDWTFRHTPFRRIYSYMKAGNEPSIRTAMSYGASFAGEYMDEEGDMTKIFMLERSLWQDGA